MPIGNYSYSGEQQRHSNAITEPGDAQRSYSGSDNWNTGVQAKEGDRQTARRSSSRSRGEMNDSDEQEESRGSSRRPAQARRATERGQSSRRSSMTETRGRQKKSRRGFAAMSPEQQREIARKGGLTVSRNRRHMADIGRVGGEHSHGGRRARR